MKNRAARAGVGDAPLAPGDVVATVGDAKRKTMKMKTNVGNLDLIMRVSIGLVLVLLMATGAIGAWGLIGLPLIVTGAARWCPLYSLVGISTIRKLHHAPRSLRGE